MLPDRSKAGAWGGFKGGGGMQAEESQAMTQIITELIIFIWKEACC